MILLIQSFLLWQVFALLMGYMEAIFFHVADYGKLKEFNRLYSDIHIHLTLIRYVVFVCMFIDLNTIDMIVLMPIAAITFPFFHDGVYYAIRNKLLNSIYTKGFFDSPSVGSTAKTKLSFRQRTILFIIGFVLWSIYSTYIS